MRPLGIIYIYITPNQRNGQTPVCPVNNLEDESRFQSASGSNLTSMQRAVDCIATLWAELFTDLLEILSVTVVSGLYRYCWGVQGLAGLCGGRKRVFCSECTGERLNCVCSYLCMHLPLSCCMCVCVCVHAPGE